MLRTATEFSTVAGGRLYFERNLLASDVRSFDPCVVDGEEAPVDEAGTLLIDRDATTADCAINGLLPDATYTLTMEQADRSGALTTVATLQGLISRGKDTRPAPLDSRPVTYALGSIILSVMVLFAYFHYRDRGVIQQKARLAHFTFYPRFLALPHSLCIPSYTVFSFRLPMRTNAILVSKIGLDCRII